MKTRIKKIILMAVALFFVSAGLSVAHDSKDSHHKKHGHAYGFYKKGYDSHPGWHTQRHKPKYHYRDRYRYREVHKVQHHYHHSDRHAPREGSFIGFKLNEPGYKVVVVVKDRR